MLSVVLNAYLAFAEVHTLTAATFDDFIKENPNTLVKFYAPWCGHCKKLAPEWEAASDVLTGKVTLAKVDLDEKENAALKQRFKIRGFPTIKYFDQGDEMEYDGGRTSKDIVKWAKKMTGEACIFLAGRNEVEDIKKVNEGEPLLAYEGSMRPGNAEFGNFQAFCKDHRQLISCLAYPGIDGEMPVMELFRPSDTSTRKPFDWETTSEEMKAFVRGEKLEYFGRLTRENWPTFKESGTQVIYMVGKKPEYDAAIEAVETVSKKTRGFYSFAWMGPDMFSQAGSMFGWTPSDGAQLFIAAAQGKKGSFHGPTDLSVESITNFVKEHKNGGLELQMKTEPIPEKDDDAVVTLVGLNVQKELEAAESYYVLIHAPWCGHCKKFKPAYSEFAEKVKAAGSKLVVSQIDATANDFELKGVSFTGFPTIYYKNNKGKLSKFAGDRTVEGLIKHAEKSGADFTEKSLEKAASKKSETDEL